MRSLRVGLVLLGCVVGLSAYVGAPAVASAESPTALQEAQALVDSDEMVLAGGQTAAVDYTDPMVEYMADQEYEALAEQDTSNWLDQVAYEENLGYTSTDFTEAVFASFYDAGLTNSAPVYAGSAGAGVDVSLLDVLPEELAVPEFGEGAAAATGIISLGGALSALVTGPAVTYSPGTLEGVTLCSNFPEDGAVVGGAGACSYWGTQDSDGFYPCLGGPSRVSQNSTFEDSTACADAPYGVPLNDPSLGWYAAEEDLSGNQDSGGFDTATCDTLDISGYPEDNWAGWQLAALPDPFVLLTQPQDGCYDSNSNPVSGGAWAGYVEPSTDFEIGYPQLGPGMALGTSPVTQIAPTSSGRSSLSDPASALLGVAGGGSPNAGPLAGLLTSIGSETPSSLVQVPDCDYNNWPEQASVCEAALQAAGLKWTIEDAPDYGDAPGTVEALMPADALNWSQNLDNHDVAAGSRVYVFVQPGAGAPAPGSSGGDGYTVPDCSGDNVGACQAAFTSAGFTNQCEIVFENLPEVPSDQVSQITPVAGTVETDPSTSCVIDGSGAVVPAPTYDELATSFETDLNTAGFSSYVDNPLDENLLDPYLQGGAVVEVLPTPGTVVDPNDRPQINIDSNPLQLPVPATTSQTQTQGQPQTSVTTVSSTFTFPNGQTETETGTQTETGNPTQPEPQPGDPFSGPTIDPNHIEFPNIDESACNIFPFGVPCWLDNQLQALGAAPIAPNFTLPTPYGPLHVNLGDVFGNDFGAVMGYFRDVVLFFSFLGIALWLFTFANRSGGSGEE